MIVDSGAKLHVQGEESASLQALRSVGNEVNASIFKEQADAKIGDHTNSLCYQLINIILEKKLATCQQNIILNQN